MMPLYRHHTTGDLMRTTALYATILAGTLALAGCSNSDGGGDAPKATATTAPALSPAEARTACIDAWADALQDADLDVDQEPAACEGLPEDDRLDRYMEGLRQRNAANRG